MKKPIKENYGYRNQDSPDEMPSGWIYEEGEEKYNEALELYEASLDQNKVSKDTTRQRKKHCKAIRTVSH